MSRYHDYQAEKEAKLDAAYQRLGVTEKDRRKYVMQITVQDKFWPESARLSTHEWAVHGGFNTAVSKHAGTDAAASAFKIAALMTPTAEVTFAQLVTFSHRAQTMAERSTDFAAIANTPAIPFTEKTLEQLHKVNGIGFHARCELAAIGVLYDHVRKAAGRESTPDLYAQPALPGSDNQVAFNAAAEQVLRDNGFGAPQLEALRKPEVQDALKRFLAAPGVK